MFRPFGADGEAGSPVNSSRRWALAVAAALVASFAVGFAVGDAIVDRRAATRPSGSARVSSGDSAAAHAAKDSAANPARLELRDEIVRVPRSPAVARADAPTDAPSRLVEHSGEQVRAIQAVGATNPNAFSPAFASNGTAIFFHTGSERDARSAIEVATAGRQGGPPVKGQLVRTPAVSPDGSKVIFQVSRHGAWILDLAEGSMQRVLTDPTAEEFAGLRMAARSRSTAVAPVSGASTCCRAVRRLGVRAALESGTRQEQRQAATLLDEGQHAATTLGA